MFTLNLLFDFSRLNGRFSGDRTGTPSSLFKSNNWLQLQEQEPTDQNFPQFDPERDVWDNLGEATAPVLVQDHLNPNQNISVRVAPDPNTPVDASTKVRLLIAFGRKLPTAAHAHASP